MPTVHRIVKKDSSARSKGDNFYQSPAWKRLRAEHYAFPDHALCYYCNMSGIVRLGPICDHYRPRRLFPELQYEYHNLVSACPHCDSKKRLFEKTVATREQFNAGIDEFIKNTFHSKPN
jgi:5-methylcytosine-specific restriction endonuclease McrA